MGLLLIIMTLILLYPFYARTVGIAAYMPNWYSPNSNLQVAGIVKILLVEDEAV
jgi:hypothetical protein